MRELVLIGFAGGVGSLARYGIGQWALRELGDLFPWGTLAVNALGSFVLGVVVGMHMSGKLSRSGTLALGTGFCGGFTTFSTFSVEAVTLFERNQPSRAAAYLAASGALGLVGATLGLFAAR